MPLSSASPHPTSDPTLSERLLLGAIRDWAALRLASTKAFTGVPIRRRG